MRTNLLFTGMLSALFFVLTPFSALAQVTSTQTLNSPPPGILLFGGYAQDFVSKFWSAFSSDVAPYASQLSGWVTPLPQTRWNTYGDPGWQNFLYDGGTPGNPRTALSQSTLGRVCYLVDPTSVPTNLSYSGSWEGTAGDADQNRVFVYSPTTITWNGGSTPAGWSDKSQQHTGCPNGDYYCHYGVSSFACTTYAPPAQTLSLDKTTITAGQSATLSWNDTLARDYFAPYGAEPDPAQVAGARPRNGVIELGETNDGVSPNSVCTSTNWSNKVSAGGYWQESSYFVCLQGTPGHCVEPEYRTRATWITDSASPATAESKSGSVTVSPTTTTTYKYSCTNANGTRTVSATVNVASAPPPPPPPSASCPATTISHCNLASTSSGGSSGSCVSGYSGSCNYSCANGTWTRNTNTCAPVAAVPAPTVTATINGSSSSAITTAQSFDLKMTSTNAAFCTWSRTGSYSGNWTNLPVPAPNTSYDSGALTWRAGNATWTFTCANSTGLKSSSASVTITNAPVNGVCAATHYNCSAGVSTSNSNNPTNYTWTCAGSNGGSNASCSETKALPDLTALGVSPSSANVGQATTLSATIANAPSAATGAGFPDLFEISQVNNPSLFSQIYATKSYASAALAAGGSNTASASYTFPSAGTWYVRACANTDTNGNTPAGSYAGTPESSYGNNCGLNWTAVTVGDVCYGLGCTTGSAGTGPGGPGGSGSTCYYGWNGQPKTNVPSQCCSLTPGVCPLAPTVGPCVANPSEVDKGQSTFIQWNSSGADSCTATGFTINGNGTSGNQRVTPQDTPITNYQISCTGPGGSGSCFVSVPVHTPQAGISSSPARVQSGGSITLTWKGTDVTFCTVSGGTGASAVNVSGPADRNRIFTTGSGAVRPITTQTTYTISCNGGAASSAVTTNILPGFREF